MASSSNTQASSSNSGDMDELKRCFIDIGKSITAKLDHNQLEVVLFLAGVKPSDEEKEQIIPQGKKQYGWTDVVHFAEELKRVRTAKREEKRATAMEACRKHDKNGSGSLDAINLVLALSTTPMRLSQNQTRAALKEEMQSSDMLIKYADFIVEHLLEE